MRGGHRPLQKIFGAGNPKCFQHKKPRGRSRNFEGAKNKKCTVYYCMQLLLYLQKPAKLNNNEY